VGKRDALRASDSDRDLVIGRLHTAATDGRIDAEELEQRVSVALKARTYGALEAIVSDLPDPGPHRQRTRHPAVPAARWAVRSVRANPVLLVVLLPGLALTFALLVAVTLLWAVLMVVALVLGHRGGGPWIGNRRQPRVYGVRPYGRGYRGLRTSGRRPGGSWL
jgi:hypothetical protein